MKACRREAGLRASLAARLQPPLVTAEVAPPTVVAIWLNWLLTLVPRARTAPMITTLIRAARRPYSIAVAPSSSFTKRENMVLIFNS